MSTKVTIKHGDNFHLYQECFEAGGNLHLTLEDTSFNVDKSGDYCNISIDLPAEIVKAIIKPELVEKIMRNNNYN